jgi:aryl-alcohol dehydrogenase-like predicted oxidoreductase
MKQQKLGTSELHVSEISLGCMSLGTEESQAIRLVHEALDLGVTTLDTADLYDRGENERILGKALQGRRDQVVLASKVGNEWRPDGSGWDWNPRKSYIKEAIFASLRRLQTDYLDLYQLHGGTIEDPMDETIEAFEELKQAGHIRAYGISSIRPNVIREYVSRSGIASVMTQYSLLDRRPEEQTLDLLQQHQISVIVRGAVAKGLLAGKPASSFLEYPTAVVAQLQAALKRVDWPGTVGQLAIRYAQSHPAVATIAVGVSNARQLKENVDAVNLPELSSAQRKELQQLLQPTYYDKHR